LIFLRLKNISSTCHIICALIVIISWISYVVSNIESYGVLSSILINLEYNSFIRLT
jgi:hypothetical protein